MIFTQSHHHGTHQEEKQGRPEPQKTRGGGADARARVRASSSSAAQDAQDGCVRALSNFSCAAQHAKGGGARHCRVRLRTSNTRLCTSGSRVAQEAQDEQRRRRTNTTAPTTCPVVLGLRLRLSLRSRRRRHGGCRRCTIISPINCTVHAIHELRKNVPKALASVGIGTIRRFFRKVLRFHSIYRLTANGALADFIATKYKSHRRVGVNDLKTLLDELDAITDRTDLQDRYRAEIRAIVEAARRDGPTPA